VSTEKFKVDSFLNDYMYYMHRKLNSSEFSELMYETNQLPLKFLVNSLLRRNEFARAITNNLKMNG
jgi:hypothetical protein